MSFSGRIFSDLLSTLLSMQARGGGVDRKNPLFWLFRFKRLLPESASQIDDCHLWSRPGNAGTEFGLWFARTHPQAVLKGFHATRVKSLFVSMHSVSLMSNVLSLLQWVSQVQKRSARTEDQSREFLPLRTLEFLFDMSYH